MLIKWGIEQADKAQLPTYLEASAEGRALYARFGFKEVEQHTFDMADYGGQGLEISTVMIRSPADCT
jgi:predicted GNAT family N-acyltransferase